MGSESAPTTITILHFNDVYNIESGSQEPVGGAARFVTAIKRLSDLKPLVLFSGDAFNPSIMSAITKGKQMVPILNAADVKVAVYGNHDFDFGVDNLMKLAKECHFPWLLSNVLDNFDGEALADGLQTVMLDWNGKKLGFIGLVEEDWIATLATIDPDEVTVLDFIEEGQSLAEELRKQGADYVIALTHMRWPNDIKLAENRGGIDLILGGHDHSFGVKEVNGIKVIKSGTDFRQMAQVTLEFGADNKVKVEVKELEITSDIPEDLEVKDYVAKYMQIMGEKMEVIIGNLEADLDGRFASVRTKETNLGNFITDIMLRATDSDVAILNSGTLRSDTLHPKGEFRVKNLMSILPMVDAVVVLRISGSQIIEALENGVSKYPALEGRFPQVGGIRFAFDPQKPPGSRVDPRFIKIQGDDLVLDKTYKVCTKSYLADGKDGYEVFAKCEVIVGEEEGPRLSTIVQNHFKAVKAVTRVDPKPKPVHRQSIISVSRRKSLVKQMSLDDYGSLSSGPAAVDCPPGTSMRRASLKSPQRAMTLMRRRSSIQSVEVENLPDTLAPKVEGRILLLDDATRRHLEDEVSKAACRLAITEDDEIVCQA